MPLKSGLTEAEALLRLAQQGPNQLPADRGRNTAAIFLDVLREPMFLLLVGGGILYLLLGELPDALMLMGCVLLVMGITIVQERRTETALHALRELASPTALVLRDGIQRRVAAAEVVAGDWLLISEGDRVPADALLRESQHLTVDESLLTGESIPVRKAASLIAQALDKPGGEGLPSLFSGTLVTSGHGLCEVLATGVHTELGRIGRALLNLGPAPSPLQAEMTRVVRRLATAGLAACVLVAIVYALTRGNDALAWKQGLLAGIAMAMSVLPEEFPVVLTVFLALGAWRIARHGVLTRRMPAIETLGACTVLCVDKTGTLTRNHMTLAAMVSTGDAPGTDALLIAAVRACRPQAFDPMDRALQEAASAASLTAVPTQWQLLREYPLSPQLPAMTQAWTTAEAAGLQIATKGAPEAVAALCQLDAASIAAMQQQVAALAQRGLRVLGVASAVHHGDLPEHPNQLPLRWMGLVAFTDPLRDEVPAAVATCQQAGIRVVMITGDYPDTALSIAAAAGLDTRHGALTGKQLQTMDDSALAEQVATVTVFARMTPDQKLRLVQALRSRGEVVAMTGDGVNDAPALKAAHIGIAMGKRGTDVAREAASLVLLDDSFGAIVSAVRLGRRIYGNIRKASTFILAVHIPVAGLSMIPVLTGHWPLLLLPIHVALLELIIDPACTLVFEADDADEAVMARPPRSPTARLFSATASGVALLQGSGILIVCISVFALLRHNHSDEAARAITYVTLVASLVALILVNRSWSRSAVHMLRQPNAAVWWVMALAVAVISLPLSIPRLQSLFSFAPVHLPDLAWSIAGGIASLAWFEVLKQTSLWRKAALQQANGSSRQVH